MSRAMLTSRTWTPIGGIIPAENSRYIALSSGCPGESSRPSMQGQLRPIVPDRKRRMPGSVVTRHRTVYQRLRIRELEPLETGLLRDTGANRAAASALVLFDRIGAEFEDDVDHAIIVKPEPAEQSAQPGRPFLCIVFLFRHAFILSERERRRQVSAPAILIMRSARRIRPVTMLRATSQAVSCHRPRHPDSLLARFVSGYADSRRSRRP